MMYTPRTWILISKKAFNHNVAHYKKIIGTRALAAVVKGNAYGHGLIEVGNLCQENEQVDWLCVALLSEALQLRKSGVTKSILVMSCIDVDLVGAVGQNIDFFIFNYDMACFINQIGVKNNDIFNVHIKIDTGLSRFGLKPDAINNFINQIRQLSHICIRGISTHCAQSNSEDQTVTRNQLEKFNKVIEQLSIDIPFKHAANSAATGAFTEVSGNLFRVGVGLYGYWPSASNKQIVQKRYSGVELLPVLTWKTRIIEIKKINVGTPVGYNGTFIASRPTTLAFIPIGYFDGYSPTFSNKSMVLVRGNQAPVVGRVAMNVVTIDITDVFDASIGDEVMLIGDACGVRAYDLALYSELNNERFITTNIHPSIDRVIIE